MNHYSVEFKEAAVKKLLSLPGQSLKPVAKDLRIDPATLRSWRDRYMKGEEMTKRRTRNGPKNWTAEQKFQAILETSSMNEAERGEYCRRNGLYATQLDEWRVSCIGSMRKGPKADPEKRALKDELKQVKRDLRRKEKALAETAALLVLKKKAVEYWGSGEDCEES